MVVPGFVGEIDDTKHAVAGFGALMISGYPVE